MLVVVHQVALVVWTLVVALVVLGLVVALVALTRVSIPEVVQEMVLVPL